MLYAECGATENGQRHAQPLGTRTLAGSDQEASEWKYIPVLRMALYLEENLYRGSKWAVF